MGISVFVFGGAAAVVLVALWANYQFEQERNEYDRSIYFDTEFPRVGGEFPMCEYPRVWKNGMSYPEGFCGDDSCMSKFRSRAMKFWGDKDVRMTLDINTTMEEQITSMRNYLSNPQYARTAVHFMQQLDVEEGYNQFFQWNADPGLNYFKSVASSPTHEYSGVQMFFARGARTGTPMHFAVAINYFAQVAGRKRWILIDPAYLKDAGCKVAGPGHFGICSKSPGDVQNFSMDEQVQMLKDAGVPYGAGYYDVILEAGDVLHLCEMWPHAIENLEELNVGCAIRTAGGVLPMRLTVYTQLAKMLSQGIYDFVTDPYRPGTRMVKMMWRQLTGQGRGVLDSHTDEAIGTSNNIYQNMKELSETFNGDIDISTDKGPLKAEKKEKK
jgi:hypothetical protein